MQDAREQVHPLRISGFLPEPRFRLRKSGTSIHDCFALLPELVLKLGELTQGRDVDSPGARIAPGLGDEVLDQINTFCIEAFTEVRDFRVSIPTLRPGPLVELGDRIKRAIQ